MSQLRDLRRDRKKSCDGNHNLVELGKAIAQIEKHTVASGRRRRMGQKAIRALIPRGLKKKVIEARRGNRARNRFSPAHPHAVGKAKEASTKRKERGRL